MSSGQSLRNGSSVEPGLPNTFLTPKARNRLKVASLTVVDLLSGLRDKGMALVRHCEERSDEAIQNFVRSQDGLLRFARNDGYQLAVALIVGWPSEFAVHSSRPPPF